MSRFTVNKLSRQSRSQPPVIKPDLPVFSIAAMQFESGVFLCPASRGVDGVHTPACFYKAGPLEVRPNVTVASTHSWSGKDPIPPGHYPAPAIRDCSAVRIRACSGGLSKAMQHSRRCQRLAHRVLLQRPWPDWTYVVEVLFEPRSGVLFDVWAWSLLLWKVHSVRRRGGCLRHVAWRHRRAFGSCRGRTGGSGLLRSRRPWSV